MGATIATWFLNLFIILALAVVSAVVVKHYQVTKVLNFGFWPAAIGTIVFWNLVSLAAMYFALQAGWSATFDLYRVFFWSVVYVFFFWIYWK